MAAIRPPRRAVIALTMLGLAQALIIAATVIVVRAAIDGLIHQPADLNRALILAGALAALAVVHGVTRAAEFGFAERIGFELARRLRMQMYRHMAGMSARQLQHRSRGAMLLRFTGDLAMLRTWISRGYSRAIASGVIVIAGVAIVGWLSVLMALALVAIFALTASISLRRGKRLRRVTRWVRRRRSLLTSTVDEQLAAQPTVQAFGRSGGETMRVSRQNDSLTSSLTREASVRAELRGISNAAARVALATVLVVGAVEVAAGRLSVGGLVAAMAIVPQIGAAVRTLGLSHDYWQRARISREKIADFMASRSRTPGQLNMPPLVVTKGRIVFEHATVNGALRDFSAVIESGDVIAITGAIGAGKSTVLSAVARLTDLDGGRILIDDNDLAQHRVDSITRSMGIFSRDLAVMRGTVRRNLLYRRRSASDEELERIVRVWRLDELLNNRPDGLSGWITEGGSNMSTGERERIALARAMLGNPPILLLDEPTSYDSETAEIVRRAIAHHHGTVLIATRDPADLAIADRVWTLSNGHLVSDLSADEYRSSLAKPRPMPAWADAAS